MSRRKYEDVVNRAATLVIIAAAGFVAAVVAYSWFGDWFGS